MNFEIAWHGLANGFDIWLLECGPQFIGFCPIAGGGIEVRSDPLLSAEFH